MVLPLARPDISGSSVDSAVRALGSGWLGRGPLTERFEQALRDYLGVDFVVAVSTGTAAIQLALESSGIGRGDEVIVPSFTFAGSYQAISAAGATPVFADIDLNTLCLDPGDVERRIGALTKAILTVHMCGHAGPRDELAVLAEEHGLILVEDGAHAFGSRIPTGGHPLVGSTGNPVCFSFDPIKSLTCGQGGAIAIGDAGVAAELASRSDLGLDPRAKGEPHVVSRPGHRFAMSDLNAAIGLGELERFGELAETRRSLLERYQLALDGVSKVQFPMHEPEHMVPFALMIRVPPDQRPRIRTELGSRGIETGVHYAPGHLQPLYSGGVELPATEQLATEVLSLPLHGSMSSADVDLVAEALTKALER